MENSEKPAFALTDGKTFANDGLTKREYFAGLAMQAIISGRNLNFSETEAVLVADQALQFSDKLLERLEVK